MNDNQNNVIDLFDWLRRKEDAAASLAPYKAYTLNTPQKDSPMMRIEYSNGQIGLLRKSYFMQYTLIRDQILSLVFSSCIITMEGQHLDRIADLLNYDEIRSLHCFNPKLHDKPDEGEVIISSISWKSTVNYYS